MQFLRLLRTTDRKLRARCHFWLGRFWLLTGHKTRAEREFREVLSQLGEDFQASLYLGRLALEAGDLPGALREMSAARRHSPERFARMRAEIWRGIAGRGRSQAGDVVENGPRAQDDPGPLGGVWTEDAGAGGSLKARRRSAAKGHLPGAMRPRRSGMTAPGSKGSEGQERDPEPRHPLPPIHYGELTPDAFDFGIEAGQAPESPQDRDSEGPPDRMGWTENERDSGFSGSWLFRNEFMGSGPNGRVPNDRDAGDEERSGTDSLHEESHEESPWMDFLSHPYLFNSLPMGESEEEFDDFDALAEDPFEFLTDEESEALSPWSDPFAAEDFQAEETPDFGSPLAGFYEELEESRRKAEEEPGSEGLTDFDSQNVSENHGLSDASGDAAEGNSDRQRFKGLPPIQEAELEAVDWQDLLDKLSRG